MSKNVSVLNKFATEAAIELRGYSLTDAFFFVQAEDGIRDYKVTGVQTCALPIYRYKYIRNYFPMIPYMQHNEYKEKNYPTWNLVKEWARQGKLNRERRCSPPPRSRGGVV